VTTPDGFDELIHAPTRLSLVALLAASEYAEFRFLRDELELSDSALSKQLARLERAGYVDVHKGFVGKRPRTVLRLTRRGHAAFRSHVAALDEIVRRGIVAPAPQPPAVEERAPDVRAPGQPALSEGH
jgi:DNA-binding MarR family transcriptional regulator